MSMSTQVFNVFGTPRFDDSIQKVEWRTYYPYVKSFRNNDVIEITINQSDVFDAMFDSLLLFSGKITKTEDAEDVYFVNNAGAFMLSSMTYKMNVGEIETVREPGLVSTVRGYLSYSSEDTQHLAVAGWNYPDGSILNANDTFNFLIPLKHIFNVFNDYQVVTCGRQTIRIVRASHDDNCFVVTGMNADRPITVKLNIENIELKVKRIHPSIDVKLKLLKAIKADTPIVIPFRKWDLHMLPALTSGATKEVWAVRTTSSVESPRYVIVCFQTGKHDNLGDNPTLFDHLNVTNIRLTLNGESFPNERMHLNFPGKDYIEAHYKYTEFYPSYTGSKQKRALLSYGQFEYCTLFAIDCSRRSDGLKSSTVDVRLDIETSQGFPANTRAYCIIVHDCIMELLPLSEIVKNLS